MKTQATSEKEIKRTWHLVDLRGKTLGHVAVTIAQLLTGKNKPYFVRNLDCGDYVVVTNCKDVQVTGHKEKEKKYSNYSGYPGGLRVETLEELRKRKPQDIIQRAVFGMLPKNKLRDQMIKRLFIYKDENHPYGDKIK